MTILQQHEILEIEVLQRLKSTHLLNHVVFGGGTMLRLCYGMNRYSADLDFWFIKDLDYRQYQAGLINSISSEYEILDCQLKHYTLLLEMRSASYPKKLKIEIRKFERAGDYQDTIAYSPYHTLQVLLRAHTLEQTMENKISALIDREEIRDTFDIEFLLRKGVQLPSLNEAKRKLIIEKIDQFKDNEYKVKLGSVIGNELRKYYIKNKFHFLRTLLNESEINKEYE